MEEENYINQILDLYGTQDCSIIWELYIQNNLAKYCKFTKDDFYEIYYSLFLDEMEKFKTIDVSKDQESEEYCEIVYGELLDDAKHNYPIADFIRDVPKDEWISIIKDSRPINDMPINITIYNFYKEKYK